MWSIRRVLWVMKRTRLAAAEAASGSEHASWLTLTIRLRVVSLLLLDNTTVASWSPPYQQNPLTHYDLEAWQRATRYRAPSLSLQQSCLKRYGRTSGRKHFGSPAMQSYERRKQKSRGFRISTLLQFPALEVFNITSRLVFVCLFTILCT